MRTSYLRFSYFFLLILASSHLYGQASQGMQTYSPYTPEQLREFNSQPIFPVEGPMGTVGPGTPVLNMGNKPSVDSKYFSQPQGEQEAESLETESAQPYQPMSPVLTF
jgi:hypothetical protein